MYAFAALAVVVLAILSGSVGILSGSQTASVASAVPATEATVSTSTWPSSPPTVHHSSAFTGTVTSQQK